LPFLWITI